MSVYLDASVLVAIFSDDAFSQRADEFVRKRELVFHISDFAAAELAAAISRKVRIKIISHENAQLALMNFDKWRSRIPNIEFTGNSDIASSESFIRRLDLNLRVPDAIHIAIALRIGATLATFDERMAECARALGVEVADA